HRRVDEQLLPPPWRAQRAGHDSVVGAFASLPVLVRRPARRRPAIDLSQRLVRRHDEAVGRSRSTRRRYLAEREILGKSRGQPMPAGAREERQKRPASRMRSPCAPVEPRWHSGATEGVLEHPHVTRWRAHENRHLVEWHTGRSLTENSPRNLDTLATFTGRR